MENKKEEIQSLNETQMNEFKIEELESRYETDPLFLAHIFGLVGDDGKQDVEPLCACKKLETCPELQCACRGSYQEACSPVCEFNIGIRK